MLIDKFKELDEQKRDRIINAGLEEFANRGYKNASTNAITQKAGISKGLLFHYFGSKKRFFLFLYDHTRDLFLEEFYNKFSYDQKDIISRWRVLALMKIDIVSRYPRMYDFLITCATENEEEIKEEMQSKNQAVFEEAYKTIFQNMDTSLFKDGLDVKQVTDMIIWVTQGFGNQELEKMKKSEDYKKNFNMNKVMAEFDDYLELLRKVFYK